MRPNIWLALNGIRPDAEQTVVNVNVAPGYCIDLQTDPRESLAANHPTDDLRTIEGKVVSRAPASAPQRATPPFPGLIQSGEDAGGPVFSYRTPKDNEPT